MIKQVVLAASITDTRKVGREFETIRALASALTKQTHEMEAAGAAPDECGTAFKGGSLKTAALDGDVREVKAEAGQSAGFASDLVPAGDPVRRIAETYLDVVARPARVAYQEAAP